MKILKSRWAKAVGLISGIPVGLIALNLAWALSVYPAQYVGRVLAWGETDAFDWQKFPGHTLQPAPTAFTFEQAPDEDAERVAALFETHPEIDDWEAFLEANHTQAFIVIQDGTILYEEYFNDTERDSIVTSFSVAKSFTSALVGIAIEEGHINSVDDPITDYLPELADRDPRFGDITIRHLLLMSSGLEFREDRLGVFNGDGPLTTYYPDQRQIALENTNIIDPPGAYFQYNKYHPQLLGMIIERTTGTSVTSYMQEKLWDPLGMEYSGSWSIDSEASDFEKMESGVNARAIDFAKFGQLYLNDGDWNGVQVIPTEWVAESTQVDPSIHHDAYYPEGFGQKIYHSGQGYYQYMWYGFSRDETDYDFAAMGDRGQYIYVSPHNNLVIVRNGVDFGIPEFEWFDLFYQFASDIELEAAD